MIPFFQFKYVKYDVTGVYRSLICLDFCRSAL